MPEPFPGLRVDARLRPRAGQADFDLAARLSSVVALEAHVAEDASTVETLGGHRLGNGVVIGAEGLVLTIGYLVLEAEAVTLTTQDGRKIAAHVLGVDPATGFGLVHALEPLNLPALPLGDSGGLKPGDPVIVAGAGGRAHALAGVLQARGAFAGYWEYYLDDALFVGPSHPHWSGTALIDQAGDLVGVGSLYIEQRDAQGIDHPLNMFVPAERLTPILADLKSGRPTRAPRPWLGVLAQEIQDQVVLLDAPEGGPADQAGLEQGDVICAILGERVSGLGDFYQKLWASGPPGTSVKLVVRRGPRMMTVEVKTIDRMARMKKRRLN